MDAYADAVLDGAWCCIQTLLWHQA